jgi:hypothetical protein
MSLGEIPIMREKIERVGMVFLEMNLSHFLFFQPSGCQEAMLLSIRAQALFN